MDTATDTDIVFPATLARDADSELETGDSNEYSDESEISEDDESSLEEIFESCMLRINQNKLPQGSPERVQFVLTELGNINLWSKAEDQKTAFHYAVAHESSEVVQLLIHKARLSLSSSSSSSSSSSANDALDQSVSLESLLRQADLLGYTALHRAVENGDLEISTLLAQADPNDKHVQNFKGETPFYTAVSLQKIEIVKMIGTTCTVPAFDGPDGTIALHAAIANLPEAHRGGSDMVKVILEAGERQFSTGTQRFKDFIRKADDYGNTALNLAVMWNHLGMVKQILKADPSYEHSDNALYTATKQGYKDIIEELCKHGGSSSLDALGPRKHTALHAAVLSGDKDLVEMILKSRIHSALERDVAGWTALHHAAHDKFDSVIEMLINFPNVSELKELLSKPDEFWEKVPTPLWLATQGGYTSTVIILMKFLPYLCGGVNDEKHRNVLHLAAHHSDKEMVQTILKHCPSEYLKKILNDKDDDGNTPLHLLIKKGCFVKELIEHKEIDRAVRNNRNWTPFDMLYVRANIIAEQRQQFEINYAGKFSTPEGQVEKRWCIQGCQERVDE
ncbi:uncharacterized protein LOC141708878 isoform X2 [Apium graveolens]|uniref:uncharacterized protein LOC141708878 isoform X2 n=1 Tax=Apium graveolens TaxID=4045 RepID=UPI003D79A1BE